MAAGRVSTPVAVAHGSAEDLLAYSDMIPVTLIDGVQHDFWRVSERRLRGALSAPQRTQRPGQP